MITDAAAIARFYLKFTSPPDVCWEWLAGTRGRGYGAFSFRGRMVGSHIISYRIHTGPIPVGKQVLHRCDNPGCVNPSHLFLGSATVNMQDKETKGRGNHARKVSISQIVELRELAHISNLPQKGLGRRFGISQAAVSGFLSSRNI